MKNNRKTTAVLLSQIIAKPGTTTQQKTLQRSSLTSSIYTNLILKPELFTKPINQKHIATTLLLINSKPTQQNPKKIQTFQTPLRKSTIHPPIDQ